MAGNYLRFVLMFGTHCLSWMLYVTVFLTFGLMLSECAPAISSCPGGTYFDKHTGRTECCDVICKYAAITGMEKECNTNCPGYGSKGPVQDSADQNVPQGESAGSKDVPARSDGPSPQKIVIGVLVPLFAVVVLAVVLVTWLKPTVRHYICRRVLNAAAFFLPQNDLGVGNQMDHHRDDDNGLVVDLRGHDHQDAAAALLEQPDADNGGDVLLQHEQHQDGLQGSNEELPAPVQAEEDRRETDSGHDETALAVTGS